MVILVIYSLAMMIVTILFMSEYMVKEEVVITRVLNYFEPTRPKNLRIHFRR